MHTHIQLNHLTAILARLECTPFAHIYVLTYMLHVINADLKKKKKKKTLDCYNSTQK